MTQNRVTVVTGAAEGLGSAITVRLAGAGHDLVLADLVSSSKTPELVRAHGVRALEAECDVSSEPGVATLADAVEEFGGADVLDHNAGVSPSSSSRTSRSPTGAESWERTRNRCF
ncbi:SDR family NAD(P)-dependent oxidoreductase [Mycobacterium sp. 852013-50091_SCH5140682]|uniref:SDR family NAD(P)-dependent oxidoreductase n=1 Tax=Mycobacterium sp. 852013-50091_SCH5140682 TaxID=1834109 RepID=UPI0009EEF7E8|nr:SDR family NAD(P)-dependent oxidoreductase [Mycobacterium sp. 852013-50091_SCH5140682]